MLSNFTLGVQFKFFFFFILTLIPNTDGLTILNTLEYINFLFILWDGFFDEIVAPKKVPYMGLWFHEQHVILNRVMVGCYIYIAKTERKFN